MVKIYEQGINCDMKWRSQSFANGCFRLMACVAISLLLFSACHSLPLPEEGVGYGKHPAYFISLDGVRADHLHQFLDADLLQQDQGLAALISSGATSYQASADSITLTAASHASMITCSPPAVHGIIANTFYRRDSKSHALEKESGFFTQHQAEPLWKAARRQGKRVLSLSYPGAATGTNHDQPDVWLQFPPEDKIEKGRIETLRWSKLPLAKDWTLAPEMSDIHLPSPQAREADLVLKLSPETDETRTIHILILNHPEPQIYFDDDKNLANGHFGVLTEKRPGFVDFFFVELNPHSSTREFKRHIFIRWLQKDTSDSIRLAISASTYNYAYPEAFRKDLERANLVWPDPIVPDPVTDKTGVSPMEYVEWEYRFNRFLIDSYEVAKRQGPFDLVLLYQSMLDVFGHTYEGQLPEPFDVTKKSDVMDGYKLAMRLVSHNVNDLVKGEIGTTPIVVVGDHGMESLETEVNLARALPPPPAGITLQNAGGMLLIYSDLPPLAWTNWYSRTISTLKDLTWKNQSVLASELQHPEQDAVSTGGASPWNYGDAKAVLFSAAHTQFVVRPERQKILDVPRKTGAHGYPVTDPNMSTLLIVNTPGHVAQSLGPVELRDAVPTLAELMAIQNPLQCSGHILKAFVPKN